jgi:AraC-like DNA-binding protein
MNTIFHESRPSHDLLPYVQTYWQGQFNVFGQDNFIQSVLPNGCIELIIHTSYDHCALVSEGNVSWSRSPEFTLLGLYEKPYSVLFAEPVQVFGIRFHPDGFRNIFGIPPSNFLATYEDGVDVLGKKIKELCSRIRDANDLQQVELANAFIADQLARHSKSYDYTHLAMQMIRRKGGVLNYKDLLQQIPISPRQLQREFKNLYGITIKDYIRLSRMNAIHRYMLSQNINLTQLPYELDFTDQSHFIREFKTFAGLPPTKFIKGRENFIVNPPVYNETVLRQA